MRSQTLFTCSQALHFLPTMNASLLDACMPSLLTYKVSRKPKNQTQPIFHDDITIDQVRTTCSHSHHRHMNTDVSFSFSFLSFHNEMCLFFIELVVTTCAAWEIHRSSPIARWHTHIASSQIRWSWQVGMSYIGIQFIKNLPLWHLALEQCILLVKATFS